MPEIGTSGSMSGDGKRSVAEWPKLPRPSSTLPKQTSNQRPAMSALRGKADMTWKGRHFRFWTRYGNREVLAKLALCKNHDLCTKCLTHIKRGLMLCILDVRNGGRHGGLRLRAREHRWPILVRPISLTKSSKMREDISGED